jgi:ABC-2 type transport system ATP-binding protein
MAIKAETAAVARALTKRYANGVLALDQLDLDIGRASITALIGNNGAGKTTFLKILAGLLTPDSGSAQALGCHPATRATWLRARLGYVSQAVELDPEMTAWETLSLFATLYGLPRATRHALVAALAESFGLAEHLPRFVSTFSGGLRQRLHLALGVLHEPELLLLDEPTAALDPAGRAFVWHFLPRLRDEGRTIIVVSHDLAEVSQHCQAIALLHKGRLLASGSPADVIAAHANWRLEVELAGRVEQDTARLQQLVSLPGVKSTSARERRLVADFAEREASAVQRVTEAILQQLVRLNAAVLGYRLHPPDLASAYFNLTGAAIEEPEQSARVESGKGAGGRYRQGLESMESWRTR